MCKNKELFVKGLTAFCLVFSLLFSVWGIAFPASANEDVNVANMSETDGTAEVSSGASEILTAPTTTEPSEPVTTEDSYIEETTEAQIITTDPTEAPTDAGGTPKPTDSTEDEQDNSNDSQIIESIPARISFMNVGDNALDPVSVTVRIDGTDNADKVSYPSGKIDSNTSSISGLLDQSKNQAFRRAVVKIPDPDNPGEYTETEITRIGTYNGNVYYAFSENDDAGILLKSGEDIVLICESRFKITYSGYDSYQGTVSGKDYVWYDEELNISIKANQTYFINRISVIWGASKLEDVPVTDLKEMQLKYDVTNLKDTYAHFTIEFRKDDSYTVTAGQIQQGSICRDQGTLGQDYTADNPIPEVRPNEDVTFILYSDPWENWAGGDKWVLNMLTVNGENVFVPDSDNIGNTQKTVLSDGSEVTVTLIAKDEGLYWKDGDPFYGALGKFRWWSNKRRLFQVTITDVKKDIVIDANFKQKANAEMIMTGLEGIEKVGAAVTDRRIGTNGYDYYYSLETDDWDNVFPIHIKENSMEGEQINFYVYSVLPGYNPYTVDIKFYSDGTEYPYLDKVFQGQGNSVNEGLPLDRIKLDENDKIGKLENYFSSAYRKFIYDTDDGEYNMYADIYANGYTHAFGLKEGSEASNGNNQMVILSASPYEYHLEFDLNGGTYDNTGLDLNSYEYNKETGIVTERKAPYTIENGPVTAYMPLTDPECENKIFSGWQLVAEDGTPVGVYKSNQAFVIDESMIVNSTGDEKLDENHKFVFKAVWKSITEETDKAPYTVKYYKEVPQDTEGAVEINGRYYLLYHSSTELGTIGSPVVVLNYRHPEPVENYVLDEVNSKLEISNVLGTDQAGYEENNTLLLLYNIKSFDLNITMRVEGDGDKTKAFQVEVTARDDEGNPITGKRGNTVFDDNGKAVFSLKDGETMIIPGMDEGYTYEVTRDTDGEYITEYINNKVPVGDGTIDGTFGQDSVTVEIIKSRELPAETGVKLGNNMAVGGFIIAALAGILLVAFDRRRRNV